MMVLWAMCGVFAAVCLLTGGRRAPVAALLALLIWCGLESEVIHRVVVESVGNPLPGYAPLPLVFVAFMGLAVLAGWGEALRERGAFARCGGMRLGCVGLGLCRALFLALLAALVGLEAALLSYRAHFGQFGAEQCIGLLQTTPHEAAEGLSRYLGVRVLGYGALLGMVVSAPWWWRRPVRAVLQSRGWCGWRWRPLTLLGVMLAVTLALVPFSNVCGDHVLYAAWKAYASAQDDIRQRQQHAVSGTDVPIRQTGEHYLLVIGESASAAHMSAYGYFRETTPWMRAAAASPRGLLLRALAVHSYTLYTVPLMLSECHQDASAEIIRRKTILNVLRERGYRTFWISNQEKTGIYGSLYNTLGAEADSVFFTHNSYDFQKSYDTELLPRIRQALRENPQEAKFIVVHLMGSHDAYARRYPPDFQPALLPVGPGLWGAHSPEKQAVIDSYDKSIAFTDAFLRELTALFAPGEKGAVFYCSDHGESSVGRFLHDSSKEPHPDMFRIPAFLWVTPAFFAAHGERLRALATRRQHFFLNDHSYELLRYLSGEGEVGLDDIFVDDFRQVFTRHQASGYDDLTHRVIARKLHTLRARTGNACLLAHSNSLAKVQLARLDGFDGVQLDAHLDAGTLRVGEDAQHSAGLTLEPYLDLLRTWKGAGLWLRLPDLSPEQAEPVRQYLRALDNRYAFRERCVLQVSPALAGLWRADGWQVRESAPTLCDLDRLPPAPAGSVPDGLCDAPGIHDAPEKAAALPLSRTLTEALLCSLATEADL